MYFSKHLAPIHNSTYSTCITKYYYSESAGLMHFNVAEVSQKSKTTDDNCAVNACIPMQTLSPHNKGLLKRAISQSGVAFCPWALNSNPRPAAEKVCRCQISQRWTHAVQLSLESIEIFFHLFSVDCRDTDQSYLLISNCLLDFFSTLQREHRHAVSVCISLGL